MAGLLAAAFGLLAGTSAQAEIGTAVGVDFQSEAQLNGTSRLLRIGDDVAVGELILTGPGGQVQILFDDNTRLVVGPNSQLRIEAYLLRGTDTVEQLTVNALTGSFRFLSGNSPSENYQINTPTGTIGVRGTELDLTVFDGVVQVLLYEGAVELCNLSGECVTLTETCELGTYDPAQANVIDLNDASAEGFIYLTSQTPLNMEFRVDNRRLCLPTPDRRSPSTSGPGDISEGCDYDVIPKRFLATKGGGMPPTKGKGEYDYDDYEECYFGPGK